MEEIDLGLQRLQKLLLEEHKSLLTDTFRSVPSPAQSARNETALALQLDAALSRAAESESSAAQSELMKKAAMNALRESQTEVLSLREELQALRQRSDRDSDTQALTSELHRKVDLLNSALDDSQRATYTLRTSLADKEAALQAALCRCDKLEAAAAAIAQAEVSRLTLLLRMRDDAIASMQQSLEEVKSQLGDARRENTSLNIEWKAFHNRKCDEYLKTISELQQTIQRNSSISAVAAQRDRLLVAYEGSSDHASSLNHQVSQLLHANAQLEQQLNALSLNSPPPGHSAAIQLQGSNERARGSTVEANALKARAASVEPRDGRQLTTPAFFITERQYSLLVEENAQLLQAKMQLEENVEKLKQQLRASTRAQQLDCSAEAEEARNLTLDALHEFCVGLGQRLGSVELAIAQQLQSNGQ